VLYHVVESNNHPQHLVGYKRHKDIVGRISISSFDIEHKTTREELTDVHPFQTYNNPIPLSMCMIIFSLMQWTYVLRRRSRER
jgi:hypothetical protein